MSSFHLSDLAALSPLLIVVVGALLILLLESFDEETSKKFSSWLAIGTLGIALVATYLAPASEHVLLTPWLKFDTLNRLLTCFFLMIGLASVLLAKTFFQTFKEKEVTSGEYFFLLLTAISGLLLIGSSADFLTLFLGIETLSISLYILCGYMKKWTLSHEAAVKYFLIGSIAAALLLYGIALIYGATGTTRFDLLLNAYPTLDSSAKILFLSGMAFVTLALAFEAAVFPLHAWAPDVYEGSPTPVTAFMAVGTKVGAFAAFIRIFLEALPQFDLLWNESLAILAIFTLIYANFMALRQTQLRRFFAYSGIANAGLLLIPIVVGTSEALQALLYYLVIYACGTFGSFAVLGLLEQDQKGITMEDLKGLYDKAPWTAAILALSLLTLAGVPPTAGFFAKFYLFKIAFEAKYYLLMMIGLLTTILSAYYYFRIVNVMFAEASLKSSIKSSWPAMVVGGGACLAIIFLSIYPSILFDLFE